MICCCTDNAACPVSIVAVGPVCWPNGNVAVGFACVDKTLILAGFGAVVVVVVVPNWRKRENAPELNWLSAWCTSNGCKAGTLMGGGGRAGSTEIINKVVLYWNIFLWMKITNLCHWFHEVVENHLHEFEHLED